MFEFVREYRRPLIAALLLHGLFAALVSITVTSRARLVPPAQLAVQAVVVDARIVNRIERERDEAQAAERRRVEEQARQAERARAERERRAEEARQAEIERRQAVERQRQAEVERQRAAEEERRRQAELDRRRHQEVEQQRLAEIERRRQAEAERRSREQAAREQAAREADLRRQLADEEARQQAEDAGLLNQYIAMIEQRVVRNWNRPPSARPGLECEVNVSQAPTGMVLTVAIGRCNGDDVVRQSIEAAVLRSSPLPPPPDPRLFERNLRLIFRPVD